ncbi:MAG: Dabb family protein [Candidatus Hydrogenedentes bacterium]|nr:Dabb family protein [Candidatus Hydrogenedentota bacterium]
MWSRYVSSKAFRWSLAAVAIAILSGMSGCISVRGSLETEETTVVQQTEPGNPFIGKVRHVVLYAYKPGTPAEVIAAQEEQGRAMANEITQIEDVEHGTILGSGGRAQGYTHGLIFTYANEADLQAYVAHPAHQQFVQTALPNLSQMLVFDYIAEE